MCQREPRSPLAHRQVKPYGGYVSAIHTAAKTGRVAVSSTSTGPARKSIIMGPYIVQGGSLDLPKSVNDLTYDVNKTRCPSEPTAIFSWAATGAPGMPSRAAIWKTRRGPYLALASPSMPRVGRRDRKQTTRHLSNFSFD